MILALIAMLQEDFSRSGIDKRAISFVAAAALSIAHTCTQFDLHIKHI